MRDHLAKSSGNAGETFTKETYFFIEYQRSNIYKIKPSIKDAESYRGAKAILKQMAVQAAENNMTFLVVLAPDELQVNPQLQKEFMLRYELDSREYDFRQPQKLLLQYLSSQGIEVLDLLPDFVEAGTTKSLYLKYDSHWNEYGNKLAGQKIWSRIGERSPEAP